MKKNCFFTFVLAAMALFTLSVTTSCEKATEDLGAAKLELDPASIVFDLDEQTIPVTITCNRDWEISIPEKDQSWLTVDNATGKGNKTVNFSVSATTSSRYTTVNVVVYNNGYEYLKEELTVSQGTEVDDNSLINVSNADNAGTEYTGVTGTVSALTNVSYVISDATGGILVYAGGTPAFKIGDVVSISGTTTSYGGLSQFDKSATVEKTGTVEADFSAPIEMTGVELDAYLAAPVVKFVKYSGKLELSTNSDGTKTYVNISDIEGAKSAKGSIAYAPKGLYADALVDQKVDVYGYLVGVSGNVFMQTAAVAIVAAGEPFELPELDFSSSSGGGSVGDDNVDIDDLEKNELKGTLLASYFAENSGDDAESMVYGKYAIVWSNGANTNNRPKYYTSNNKAVRLYVNNTVTISTTDESDIKSIDMTFNDTYSNLSANVGEFDRETGKWTGSAKSVTFTSGEFELDSNKKYQSHILTVTLDGFVGDGGVEDVKPNENYKPGTLGESFLFVMDSFDPASQDKTVAGGIEFEYSGVSFDADFGTIYISADPAGYIKSVKPFTGLKNIVVTGNKYVAENLVVKVGPAVDNLSVLASTSSEIASGSGWGSTFTYVIPADAQYIAFEPVADSKYNASVTNILFSYEEISVGGGDSGDDSDATLVTMEPDSFLPSDFVFPGVSTGYELLGDFSIAPIDFKFAKADVDGTVTPTKVWNNTDESHNLRIYKNNVITLASASKAITKVEFSSNMSSYLTIENGEFDVAGKVWTATDAAGVSSVVINCIKSTAKTDYIKVYYK